MDGYPINDVTLKDVTLENCPTPYIASNIESFCFDDVTINGEKLPFTLGGTSGGMLSTAPDQLKTD